MHIFRAHKSMPRAIYLGYHKRRYTSKKSIKTSPIATAIAIMNALITLALAIAIMNALITLALVIAIMSALTKLAIAIMNALTKLAIAIKNALTTLAIAIINALMVLTMAKKPLNFTPKPDGLQEAWLPRVLRKRT